MSERTLAKNQLELFDPSAQERLSVPSFAGEIAVHDLRERSAEPFVWSDAEYDGVTLQSGEKPVDDLTAAVHFIDVLKLIGDRNKRFGGSKYKLTEVGSLALSYAYEGRDKDAIMAKAEEPLTDKTLAEKIKTAHGRAIGTEALVRDGSNPEWAKKRQAHLFSMLEARYGGSGPAAERRRNHIKELKAYIDSQQKVAQ